MELSQRRQQFFEEQYQFGKNYLAAFLGIATEQYRGWSVLEVGGGEFGLLKALSEYGAQCMGIDIAEDRINYAKQVHHNSAIDFHLGNICDYESIAKLDGPFDLIVLRDVIEHILHPEVALEVCVKLLKVGGRLFISFPPIFSPFGGHQQNFKYGKVLPFIHILPNCSYRFILKKLKAPANLIDALLINKSTGITIRRISRIIEHFQLEYVFKKCYLIRPDYEIRFHLKRRSCFFLNTLPLLREFFSTGCILTLKKVTI